MKGIKTGKQHELMPDDISGFSKNDDDSSVVKIKRKYNNYSTEG